MKHKILLNAVILAILVFPYPW